MLRRVQNGVRISFAKFEHMRLCLPANEIVCEFVVVRALSGFKLLFSGEAVSISHQVRDGFRAIVFM